MKNIEKRISDCIDQEMRSFENLPCIAREWALTLIDGIIQGESEIEVDPEYFGLNDSGLNWRARSVEEAVIAYFYPVTSIYRREYENTFGELFSAPDYSFMEQGEGSVDISLFEDGIEFYTNYVVHPFFYQGCQDRRNEFYTYLVIRSIERMLRSLKDQIDGMNDQKLIYSRISDLVKQVLRADNGCTGYPMAYSIWLEKGNDFHYSRLTEILCKKVGIPCYTVKGIFEGQPHHWNRVLLNGKWRYSDNFLDAVQEDCSYFLSETLWPDHLIH